MTQSSGFMFAAKLTAGPVSNGGTIAIMTPDASSPNLDRVNWQVAANGYVYVSPEVQLGIGSNFINVTNRTGLAWPQHSEVVVCTPYIADQTALEATVATHTTQIAAHETRIAALEAAAP